MFVKHLPINHRETETTCSEKWSSAFNRTPGGTVLTRYLFTFRVLMWEP